MPSRTVTGASPPGGAHVPLASVARERKQLDPPEETWQRVLDTSGRPASMVGT